MKKPTNIEYEYDSYILLKFYDEEWCIDSFRSGILFMRSQEQFAKMDDVGRGDELEDKSFVVVPGKDKITEMKYVERDGQSYFEFYLREKKSDEDKGVYFMAFNSNSKLNKIFSMYALWFNSKTGAIRGIDKKMIEEFGSECCIIYNPTEFYKRVFDVDNANTAIHFVEYLDLENDPIQEWNPFTKDYSNYGHQSEIRVLYKSNDEEETRLHNLGRKIDDISVKSDALTFIEKFAVVDGQLKIPIKI